MTSHAAVCTSIVQRQQGWLFGVEPKPERGPAPRADEPEGKYGDRSSSSDALDEIVAERGAKSYLETYTWTTPEAFGLVMARYFRFDGCEIMKAASHALEDANFHSEAAEIMKMGTEGGCAG